MLFEAYLRARGYTEFEFEKVLPGTSRRPDYSLPFEDGEILLEVKEFQADSDDAMAGPGVFDPYPPLREKIDAARDKFKKLKKYCCCLVLYNYNKPLILMDWQHIYGAMLGNVGFSVPLDIPGLKKPTDTLIRTVFLTGGKMIRWLKGVALAPQNQTISAVLVLSRVPVGERLLWRAIKQRQQEIGREFGIEEIVAEAEAAVGSALDQRHRPLRVVVHENPYARIPLPASLFRGPYDERYGSRDGRIQLVLALAENTRTLLIQNRVEGQSRLAGLSVADDQLPLAPIDRNHHVDRFEPGLERFADTLAIDDARREPLDGARRRASRFRPSRRAAAPADPPPGPAARPRPAPR